jgi:23S rRNA (adenine2030-N6)-methyltransferase
MNYRHAYHAGNFADVLKHVVLALVIEYLKRKPSPFRVIDVHAGAGRYALTSPEAGKTGEWLSGIGRLLGANARPLPADAARHLQPYLQAVRAENPGAGLEVYPGSPALALRLMRGHDVLIANELHPEDRKHLKAAIGSDRRAKVLALDAWVALKSLLPPKERRAIVLIDPPFEEAHELDRIAEGLAQGLQRFATGVYLAWYPIKDPKPIARFHADLAARGFAQLLRIELLIHPVTDSERLNGCGLIVANPPFTLEAELAAILPELARRLAPGRAGARYRLDWIEARDAGPHRPSPRPKQRVRPSR